MFWIYEIRCIRSGNVYIGMTKNVARRWSEHISELQRNKHLSNLMQTEFNLYGLAGFTWQVTHEVETREEAHQIERALIKDLDPKYNTRNR